ncbi:MAG: hypothetical protein Fur0025_14520 [Oscillatoriaceae cyanobacterium]
MMKHPLEFYGFSTNELGKENWGHILAEQNCPFISSKCVKQRKSNPEETIGACMVGYQDKPLIICPKRFLENHQIFVDALRLLASPKNTQYFILPEMAMPGGSIDYFLVAWRDGEVIDYLGLEIQGLDTTGTGGIWQARQDLAIHMK